MLGGPDFPPSSSLRWLWPMRVWITARAAAATGQQRWKFVHFFFPILILLLLYVFFSDEGDGEVAALSPVLYREKLVKEFNCRGFVRFRNLAKMSRPKKKKKRNKGREEEDEEREGNEARSRRGKSDFSIVEVVRCCSVEDEEEGLGRLLGDDFARGRWTGPTRLLLLDERYADKGVEELPEAVKAILHGDARLDMPSKCELVQCRLTLFYDYWSMNEVVLDKNKPKIQTVVNKIDAIQNDYRAMQLEILAGNHSLVTTVVENGIRFHVNLATVYWNSRLATERQRLICGFTGNDVILNLQPLAVFELM